MTSRTEIKFQPNVPVEVLLDRGSEGKEYPSKFENAESRWYYTVNGNEAFMYLPTSARNQLVRTRAAAGDTVRICRTVDGKSTQWYMEVLSDATEPVDTNVFTPGPRIVAPSPARTNGVARGTASTLAKPEVSQSPVALQPGGPETSGANALAVSAKPAAASTPAPHGHSHLAQCLCSAIDAAVEASEYARSKNFSVTFLGSDIRAMANSLLIGDQQGGRRG